MRITNSTLRRIIAEEYAEILAETKKRDPSERVPGGQQHRAAMGWDEPEEEIDWEDEEVDYYGDPDPFGDDAAEAQGLEPDSYGGWKPSLREEDSLDEGDPNYRDPGDDQSYVDHLQQQHGHFTSPENIPGTHAYKQRHGRAPVSRGDSTMIHPQYPATLQGDEEGYNYDLERRHGSFTSPENIPGTHAYRQRIKESRWSKLAGLLKD